MAVDIKTIPRQAEPAHLDPAFAPAKEILNVPGTQFFYAGLSGGFAATTVSGSELYQSILRVKYIAAATAMKLAIAPTSNELSSSRNKV